VKDCLQGLSPVALADLAGALESGALTAPYAPLQLRRLGCGGDSDRIASDLSRLASLSMPPAALAAVLRLVAAERHAGQQTSDRTELVWTGPETRAGRGRDTAVVVRDLFLSAEHSVLVASYALHQGREMCAPLARRMDEQPALQVKLFVNVPREYGDTSAEASIVKAFADRFVREHWPGARMPLVYYDPRSLANGPGPRSSLHAKVIVVDDARAFVTSANLTEAAQERNIEAGVLVDSRPFATSLRLQFEALVESGLFKRLPVGP
jgi:phosphatidylserine/phosphatidylglycerophosphate/cardiolipin synthase-like enzyme